MELLTKIMTLTSDFWGENSLILSTIFGGSGVAFWGWIFGLFKKKGRPENIQNNSNNSGTLIQGNNNNIHNHGLSPDQLDKTVQKILKQSTNIYLEEVKGLQKK